MGVRGVRRRGAAHPKWKGEVPRTWCAIPGCENELTRRQVLQGCQFCSAPCSAKVRRGQGHPMWRGKLQRTCARIGCENELKRRQVLQGVRHCSRLCSGTVRQGSANHNWRGGAQYRASARVWIRGRGHVSVSRLAMEKELERELSSEEVVHHIDGDPGNNELWNLRLFPSGGEHIRFHMRRHKERCTA